MNNQRTKKTIQLKPVGLSGVENYKTSLSIIQMKYPLR